jgi:hypothetical protein
VQPSFTSSGPNILLSILFSNIPSL